MGQHILLYPLSAVVTRGNAYVARNARFFCENNKARDSLWWS